MILHLDCVTEAGVILFARLSWPSCSKRLTYLSTYLFMLGADNVFHIINLICVSKSHLCKLTFINYTSASIWSVLAIICRGMNLHWPYALIMTQLSAIRMQNDSWSILMHLSVWFPQWSISLQMATVSSFIFPFYSESTPNYQTTVFYKAKAPSFQYIHYKKTKS